MSFAGLRGTGDWGADERPKSFREMVMRLNPNGDAPIFALSSKMNRMSVDDPEHAWFEKDMFIPRLRMTTGLSSATASTTVEFDQIDGVGTSKGNALDLRPGDLVMAEVAPGAAAFAAEIMEVSSITDLDTIVVKRGQAGTSALGQAAATFLTRIGNRNSEGSGSPAVSSRNPTKLSNFTQIFKTAFEVTGTAAATRTRTEPALTGEQIDKAFEHAASIEYAALFGEKSEVTGANGKPLRTMRGLLRHITTNLASWNNAAFTVDAANNFFGSLFASTAPGIPNERLAFCGNAFLTKLNQVIAASSNTQFQFVGTLKLFGLELQKYVTPHGTIAFRTHPLMTQNAIYTNSCIVMPGQGLSLRPLKGRDTKVDKGPGGRGIQANDADTIKHQWMSELTLEVIHEKLFGVAHWLDA